MLDNFTPVDNGRDDNDYHKQVRAQTQQPTTTADREFTIEDIRDALESMDNKKASREGSITGDIYNHAFKILPKSITQCTMDAEGREYSQRGGREQR